MRDDIISKLRSEIRSGIATEIQVVYMMAGIRKILEQSGSSDNFGRLKFYCDWVLHHKLKKRPAGEVVQRLECIYQFILNGINEVPEESEAGNFIRFKELKEDLRSFLENYRLENFTSDSNNWLRFVFLYCRVVEDCSLQLTFAEPINVEQIVLKVDSYEQIDGHIPFKIKWNFHVREGCVPAVYHILNSYEVVASELV